MQLKKYIGDRHFYKSVLTLVIPIIVQNGITTFVNLLDNIMVGQLGAEQLSGVGIANQLIFVYTLALFGGLSGAGIFTAQFFGKSDREGMMYTFRYKLYTAFLITVIGYTVLSLWGEPLMLRFMTEDSAGSTDVDPVLTMQCGLDYLKWALVACIPMALTNVYASTMRETGHTTPPMIASAVAVATNALCNYIFIFGKLGLPAMGVVGAALGTIVARVIELAIVMIWTHTHPVKAPYIKGAYRSPYMPGKLTKEITIKGFPLMMNELLWSSGITVLQQCYSTRGLDAVASVNISTTIANLFNIVYMAMGTAVAIMVGNQLGAGEIDEAKDTDRKIIVFSLLLSLGIGGLMALLAPAFTLAYNVSDLIKSDAASLIIVCACMMPINSFIHNCYFTLRSGGQTFITFLFDSTYVWLIDVPGALLLSRLTAMPILPLYICVVCLDLPKCLIGTLMLKSGKWAKKLV